MLFDTDSMIVRCSNCLNYLDFEIKDNLIKVEPCIICELSDTCDKCDFTEEIESLKQRIIDSETGNLNKIQTSYELDYNERY